MRTREYLKLAPKYQPAIEGIATKLTRKCPWFREDLIQEGHCCLRALKLTRARKPDPYIRQAMYNRMVDALRRLRPDMVDCSIEQAFYRGYALTHADGEFRLQWAKEGWPRTYEMFL